MSTTGQFSSKNPTLKRILKEASELAHSPSSDYHAAPLETDLFEWHFTIRGPPEPSPFAGGLYHGRIVLPPAYPLKPPSFRFLTPTGRFEVNREICLSISGHHEETWQPAWGIRTALVAIRSFMDTSAGGQLGGMEASDEVRRRMAGQSAAWGCGTCGKRNEAIMREQDAAVEEAGGEKGKEEVVPEELRLAFREDLGKEAPKVEAAKAQTDIPPAAAAVAPSQAAEVPPVIPSPTPTQPQSQNQTQTQTGRPQVAARRRDDEVPAWIDKAIYGIIAAILFMVFKKWLI